MEKIINFKAKKKKLIFKTGILDNFCSNDDFFPLEIKILANGFFIASYNDASYIYDNNFTKVFTFDAILFQLDEYTYMDEYKFFMKKSNKIIRFNKQYNNYSILYNIDEKFQFIFKLNNNIYTFKRNKDLVILEEEESNVFCKYELSNVFEIYKEKLFDSEKIIYFTFNKIKFGLYFSKTFIIFEFKDKAINILNKKSINLNKDILEVIMVKENIIIFLCDNYKGDENFIYTFNIETMEIISKFNMSDKTISNIYFSLDDINAFKFMRIIDEDLYDKYHKFIKNKKKVLKIIFKETNINKLYDDIVTNYQIYYIMSNYFIIKGPVINIGSFCSLYRANGFDTEKFIINVQPFITEEKANDDDYGYDSIKYGKFLSNEPRVTDFGFLFNKKVIIFYAEGDVDDDSNFVYALSYIKFKKTKQLKKIINQK